MKKTTILSSALFVFSTVAAGNAANATVVDFSGSNVNMGTLQYGQTGTITDILALQAGTTFASLLDGFIPKMSEVTFTYTLPSMYTVGSLDSKIGYNYFLLGNTFKGSSDATSQTDISNNTTSGVVQQGFKNGLPGVSQVFATANLTTPGDGTASGEVMFANYTTGFQSFNSQFLELSACDLPPGSISYQVSTIPLPASLPMLLLALGALFGFSEFKMRHKTLSLIA